MALYFLQGLYLFYSQSSIGSTVFMLGGYEYQLAFSTKLGSQ